MSKESETLTRAQYEAEAAKKRLAASLSTLQSRLRPANLVSNAWDGVRDKSGVMADDAVQAVKARPATASGILAAFLLFLARDPLRRVVSRFIARRRLPEGAITTRLKRNDKEYDLTAPKVDRRVNEGVA